MGSKTYNKVVKSDSDDLTHDTPFVPWTGFDSFWHEYCRKNATNPRWKDMVKSHIEKLGLLNDQTRWEEGVKNFGC